MFFNYLVVAWRNLARNKVFSLLNIFGLSIGIACFALILLWVEDELSFDDFQKHKAQIYQVLKNKSTDGQISTEYATPGELAEVLKKQVPAVKNAARISGGSPVLFSVGEKTIYQRGKYIDASLFDMYTFQFLYGSFKGALNNPQSLVLSKSMAERFFNDKNPIGQTLKVSNDRDYIITAVVADMPTNSTFQFDYLMPFALFEARNKELLRWENGGATNTIIELHANADLKQVTQKIAAIYERKTNTKTVSPFLFAMEDWYLQDEFESGKQTGGGRIAYVRMFSIVAMIILVIACINFMNLTTAQSGKRAKEIGVRKVLGAERIMLIRQFISESLFISFLAVLLAVGIILLVLPYFNQFIEKELTVDLPDIKYLVGLLGIGFATGLLSGSYPALFLSSFNPVRVFKGSKWSDALGALWVRKGLVVIQFTCSIAFIIGAIIVYQQLELGKKRELGYNKDNLVYIPLNGDLYKHFDAVRQELISAGAIENAALSNQALLHLGYPQEMNWRGKGDQNQVTANIELVSPTYIETMDMEIKHGRDFYPDASQDKSNIIVNEAFAELMGKENPVGDIVNFFDKNQTIIGVVENFIYSDMYSGEPQPLVILCAPRSVNLMFARLSPQQDLSESLKMLEAIVKKYNPAFPVEYTFINERFNNLFKKNAIISGLANIFVALTIIISCFGLFGLAIFTAEQRRKEIAIRKTLGAGIEQIVGTLSKDFLQLVLLAFVIATPITWYFGNHWLADFAYRIELNWWIFAGTGLLTLGVAFITITYPAIKTALANPIKALKEE